ncbi:MAG: hypothetical protein QM774_14315 [Gordonia sp. (in: high G+C Gram-positive bacteria)]|uniref:hypothetical protein n=1 Tax=Gordonia sp. (in: high G+C Gram-positive bacteria) TaxID=84139 RepID=UPI0039E27E38
MHWGALAGGLVLIFIAVMRLLGRYTHEWNRATIAVIVASLVGAAGAFFAGTGFAVTTGVYVVVLGAVLAIAGAGLILAKR